MKKLVLLVVIFTCAICNNLLNAQITDKGLVAYYTLNGDAKDRSGNCYHGTINNATLTTDRFGEVNAAYHFDGTVNQYIKIDGEELDLLEFTYSLWVLAEELPAPGDFQDIISIGGDEFQDQSIQIRNNGFGGTSYNDNLTNYVLYGNDPVPLNKWVHLVMTRSVDGLQFYEDGKLIDEVLNTSNLGPFYSNNNTAYLGLRHIKSNAFKGKIDDVRIYNRAISIGEITSLYNNYICYSSISVTDTLIINANITSYNPVNYDINIKAYPNPTLDHLIIEIGDLSKAVDYSLKITNASGVSVYESDITQKFYDLNMNNWTGKGLYLFYLYDKNGNVIDVKKIILQ